MSEQNEQNAGSIGGDQVGKDKVGGDNFNVTTGNIKGSNVVGKGNTQTVTTTTTNNTASAGGPDEPGAPTSGANDTADGPGYTFEVKSIYGHKHQRGLVEIYVNGADFSALMLPDDARDLALNLLQCAEAAESDEILIRFLTQRIGLKDNRAKAGILNDFRQIRQQVEAEKGN